MKKDWFLVFISFLSFHIALAQFNFRQHNVVAGDDVYSIAKEYGTTPKGIYTLNPTAKQGIQPGSILVIPNAVEVPELPVEGVEIKKVKVKKKQTLYSISKKHNVSIEDIKKYNSFLENEGLKKGDILKIPLPAPETKKVIRSLNKPVGNESNKATRSSLTQIYTVKPKETRYGIARKFGITIPELENMNPNLGEEFPVGIQILVPADAKKITAVENQVAPKLKLYKVPSKQTMFSLAKEFNISSDSIIKLNPELKDGLKSGMILQMPDLSSSNMVFSKTNLANQLYNLKEKNIAVLLPFGIEDYSGGDNQYYKTHLEKSKVTRLVVDFYAGVTIALEKAKELGIDAKVTVVDTQKNKTALNDLIAEGTLTNSDAIIGPLYSKNVSKLAGALQNTETPIFSPISNKVIKGHANLYQSLPDSKILEEKIIAYVKKDSLNKNIIIIADSKHSQSKKRLLSTFPNAKILDPEDDNFITVSKLDSTIGEEESEIPNWVFLESSNLLLVSNVVSLLSGRAKTHKITLFTTDKSSVYDNEAISNSSLSNLNFHYPSANKTAEKIEPDFLSKFSEKYGSAPNGYAIRGYDLMFDVLLRLSASTKLSELNNSNVVTEYIENKFQYVNTPQKGVANHACYIIKYCENLLFEEVE